MLERVAKLLVSAAVLDDVLYSALVLLVAEPLMLRRRYVAFSPLVLFLFAYIFVYVAPYYGDLFGGDAWVLKLSSQELDVGVENVRCFFYSWVVGVLFLVPIYLRRARLESNRFAVVPLGVTVRVVFLMLFVYFLYIGSGVDFNPVLMIDRMINPRAYTYIKEGFGPLIFINTCMQLIALFMVLNGFFSTRRKVYLLLLFVVVSSMILGGGKSQFLMVVIFSALLYQKSGMGGKVTLGKKIGIFALFLLLMLGAFFSAFVAYGDSDKKADSIDVLSAIVDYQREAYYSAKVAKDFDWDPEFVLVAVVDTATAVVPRFLWEDKPYFGFYNRYWRPLYEPDTVAYHTTTYGALAEGHMVFGGLGPFFYGLLWAFFVALLYRRILLASKLHTFFISVYLSCLVYFFLRAGFLFSTPWNVVIFSGVSYIFLSRLERRRLGRV